jgi:poly(hydroxyalkanoate) granule-associated protein
MKDEDSMTTKSKSGETKNNQSKIQDDVKETAHRIWLAGLGALAAAEEEGTKLFSRLVDRGRDVESRGKVEVDKVVDKANEVVDKAKSKAGSTWDDLGSKDDETITSALHRLGVPTRDEIRNLTQRVEELNAKVELLRPRVTPAGPATSAASEKPAVHKPAAKSASKVV